ncbi:MAG TPA: ABC transporter ATP-binding protein [Planctomycetes bacterium]|nr:ABC transporter ATP-binding protein [Planctomycetota bacterium]HIK59508.1 ABC transporter ATP-binding protein [Planctomycetota bacterium]
MTKNKPIAISVRGLRARMGANATLGPLDLDLAVGEHALLVGPSGCGKSSLLRILAGLLPADAGVISLFGQEVSRGSKILVPPRRRGIGFLFQGGALWPHMSVAAHLDFVLRCAAVTPSEWDARRAELLTQVGLEGFGDRRPGTLSGGEAQRLALARALAPRPRLLLLDEPLGPLDAERRTSLLELFEELRRSLDLTILHVTHDPAEASSMTDRTLQMQPDGTLAGASKA